VDYALKYQNQNKVFIEVKKIGIDLEKHQEQLLNYSFQEGVKLAVLSNGIGWWLFLPLREGSWEQRKFYTIEIFDQEPKDIAQKFVDFLSKNSVISGNAIENAEKLFKSKQKEALIKENLPKAWNKLLRESNEDLIELLADTTEKLCGYKPTDEVVEQFITSYILQLESSDVLKTVVPRTQSIIPTQQKQNDDLSFAYKQVSSFIFNGKRQIVRTWRDLLIQVSILMLNRHQDQFSEVLKLSGRKRPYFSKNPKELRYPEKLNGTDIYVETNLSATNIMTLTRRILTLFGHSDNEWVIEYR
jgi:hypothetical protein